MNPDQLSRLRDDSSQFPGSPQQVRPTATPVDTFTAPQAGAQLQQLAQGLSSIAPSLNRFSDAAFQREQEGAHEQATTAASKAHEQRLAYADAVKQGVIKPNENPWFQYYYKQQSGALAAGDYGSALEAEMKTNPAWVESTDPADFHKLEGEFRKQWMKDNVGEQAQDPHYSATFSKIMDGVTQDAANRFASEAGARMQLKAGEQLNQLLNQTIDRSIQKGEGRDMLLQQLNAIQDRYLKDNPKGGIIANQQITRAIQSYALLHPDQAENVFDLAKDIRAGSGTLDGIGIFRSMVAETKDKLTTTQLEGLKLQDLKETNEDKRGERDMWSRLVDTLQNAQDPQTADLTSFITEAKKYGNADEMTRRIMGLRQNIAQKDEFGNENTFRRASLRIYGLDPEHPGSYMNMQSLAGLANLESGLRISSSQFLELAGKIKERDNASDQGKVLKEMQVLTNPAFVEAKNLLRDGIMDPVSPSREQATNYGLALEDLTMRYLGAIPQIEGEPDLKKRMAIVNGLVHETASTYAPDMARVSRADNETNAQDNAAKTGVYHAVISKITTPDDRRQMTRIEDEVGDINRRPLGPDKKPKQLSEGTIRFLYNKGMSALYKSGQKVSLDDINDFLSEYRQSTKR